PVSKLNFTLPPQGSVAFRSTGASVSAPVTGWAIVGSSLPIQSAAQFSFSSHGIPQQAVTSLATQVSQTFRSPATISTGVAVANVASDVSLPVTLSAIDTNGQLVAKSGLTLPALGHRSFSVADAFPSLSNGF